MPKLACRCGYVHDLTPQPDSGWSVLRDDEINELIDAESQDSREAVHVRGSRALYQCPGCGRLALETAPLSGAFSFFSPRL